MLLTNLRIVLPDRVLDDAFLLILQGKISRLGAMASPEYVALAEATPVVDIVDGDGATAVPGFIDIHHHGNHGADVRDASADALETICRGQLEAGVTTFLGTVISSDIATMCRAAEAVTAFRGTRPESNLYGIHYEGPFLSPKYAGAQKRDVLRAPDEESIKTLLDAAGDDLKMITIAPELPGALAAIERLSAKGIRVALGHTDADTVTAREAFARGATIATHLFNAMRPLHHREPGIIGCALTDPAVFTEVILDGYHVHEDTVRLILAAKGADRVVGISDAMRAAGMPDGPSELGGQPVMKRGCEVRLADGTLAGSALTQDRALRFLHETIGADLPTATRVLSAAPAAALGLTDRGVLARDKRADLLLLNEDLTIRRRMLGGRFVTADLS